MSWGASAIAEMTITGMFASFGFFFCSSQPRGKVGGLRDASPEFDREEAIRDALAAAVFFGSNRRGCDRAIFKPIGAADALRASRLRRPASIALAQRSPALVQYGVMREPGQSGGVP